MATTWAELVDEVEHHLGMFTGRALYDRACALITGFDMAEASGVLDGFRNWMVERHPSKPSYTWSALVLDEVFGADRTVDDRNLDRGDERAIEHLCELLRMFLTERGATP